LIFVVVRLLFVFEFVGKAPKLGENAKVRDLKPGLELALGGVGRFPRPMMFSLFNERGRKVRFAGRGREGAVGVDAVTAADLTVGSVGVISVRPQVIIESSHSSSLSSSSSSSSTRVCKCSMAEEEEVRSLPKESRLPDMLLLNPDPTVDGGKEGFVAVM
jgi:hypothetical protein